ncbi:MAG: hypothetical protein KIT17_18320 [Rubrivivax sp.]|nr:hypothetical protein [Rubrivivax sp.]
MSPEAADQPDLRSPLAVVCHDAGACNVILPWLRRPDLSLRPVMGGPAEKLFRTRFGGAADVPSDAALAAALRGAAMLLSGTGWAGDLEHRARRLARERGVFSVAVIDHWVNYAMRFERDGETVWPDEFWVTDDDALTIARRTFPGRVVRCVDNAYLRAEAAAVPRLPVRGEGGGPPAVLYVLEPMRSDWGRGTPGEFQALDHFVRERMAAGVPAGAPLRLRPHPSDPPGKYDAWIAAQRRAGLDVALDRHASLSQAIGASAWVAGCESFALVVALRAGRRVISTLPPWAPPCRLPQAGIVRLGRGDGAAAAGHAPSAQAAAVPAGGAAPTGRGGARPAGTPPSACGRRIVTRLSHSLPICCLPSGRPCRTPSPAPAERDSPSSEPSPSLACWSPPR